MQITAFSKKYQSIDKTKSKGNQIIITQYLLKTFYMSRHEATHREPSDQTHNVSHRDNAYIKRWHEVLMLDLRQLMDIHFI